MGALVSAAVSLHGLLTGFGTGPATLAADGAVAVLAAVYLRAAAREARARRWQAWRAAAFVAGAFILFVAIGSGVGTEARRSLVVHVAQYLLLADVAPALLALGAPVTLALKRAKGMRIRLERAVGSRALRVVVQPVVVAVVSSLALLVYFLSPLYAASERDVSVLAACDACFVATGLLYWGIVVAADPPLDRLSHPLRLLFLAAGIPVVSLAGLSLSTTHRAVGPTLADTHRGGAALWGGGVLVLFAAMAAVFWLWSGYERRASLLDDVRRDEELARRTDSLAGGTFGLRRPKPPPEH